MGPFPDQVLIFLSKCSTFVLMFAYLIPIVSDTAPRPSQRADFGDRFRYWRGISGTRYLFSAVPFDALSAFRRVAAIVAEPGADGNFVAWSAALIDSTGRLNALDAAWPAHNPTGSIVFVHFLAENDAELERLLGDLFPRQSNSEFRLAA